MSAYIFDLDGTLVDSYPAIAPNVQTVCAEQGLELSPAYIREAVLQSSVGAFLEETANLHSMDLSQLQRHFATLNDSNIDAIIPMPHAVVLLQSLTDAGHHCFIFTHRGASCNPILERTGLEGYFIEVVTSLYGFPRKPAPDAILYLLEKHHLDPSECFYVGDRKLDIDAANNAGIGSILYSNGVVQPDGTETYVVNDLLDILQTGRQKQAGQKIC